jgi:sensor histidine kinase regulating citrate/malate metabolism
LQEASNKGIQVNIDIKIPEVLEMNAYDITTILGNLLDNAVEAIEHIKGKKIINVDISYTKGRVLIEICNPINRELIMKEGLPITTKSKKEDCGIGLKQVRKVLEKYNGDIEITIDKNVFKIFIFIYLEQR